MATPLKLPRPPRQRRKNEPHVPRCQAPTVIPVACRAGSLPALRAYSLPESTFSMRFNSSSQADTFAESSFLPSISPSGKCSDECGNGFRFRPPSKNSKTALRFHRWVAWRFETGLAGRVQRLKACGPPPVLPLLARQADYRKAAILISRLPASRRRGFKGQGSPHRRRKKLVDELLLADKLLELQSPACFLSRRSAPQTSGNAPCRELRPLRSRSMWEKAASECGAREQTLYVHADADFPLSHDANVCTVPGVFRRSSPRPSWS